MCFARRLNVFSLFPDDQESKANDGNTDDKPPEDQPDEEVQTVVEQGWRLQELAFVFSNKY